LNFILIDKYNLINNLNMNKTIIYFLIVLLFPLLAIAQKNQNQVLLSIDQKNYSLEEFMYVYNKNNNNSGIIDQKTKSEYLDLYVNFRLKVKEAEDLGMDTSLEFRNELAGYRSQLAKPYLTDKSIDEIVMREAYDRLQWDIRASHIMIAVPEEVSKNDSVALSAYNKLIDIRKKIINGADFAEMARKYSDDPSARDLPEAKNRSPRKGNGGDLGYFTAFYMVYPFENAAYSTPIGEISMPIRTQFGYHIIKVTDKIPELGKIEVKHINIKPTDQSAEAINKSKAKIDEIAAKIKAGNISFEEAARQYSDDKGSAEKDGLLPVFEVSRMVPEFIKAISSLQVDQVSEPVFTDYGWHLIKLVRLVKNPSYEEFLPSLQLKVTRDSRSNKSKESALAKFKTEFGFKEYPKVLTKFYSSVDSSIYNQKWTADKVNSTAILFKLNDKKYTANDFAKYLEGHQTMKRKGTIRYFTDKIYNQWVEEAVFATKDANLESEFRDFKMLMQEYHDGILLFAISDQEVWGKAIRDSLGLTRFYEENRGQYQWKERVEATIYKCGSDSVAQLVNKWLKAELKLDSIVKMANRNSALNLQFEKGKYEPEDNAIIDQIQKKLGISNIIKDGNTYVIVDVQQILPAQNKSIEEAKGIITADYQNYLEAQWIKQLHQSHQVNINKALIE
jgi:peptidyl-prolyl cis-trans isomerase SurA